MADIINFEDFLWYKYGSTKGRASDRYLDKLELVKNMRWEHEEREESRRKGIAKPLDNPLTPSKKRPRKKAAKNG